MRRFTPQMHHFYQDRLGTRLRRRLFNPKRRPAFRACLDSAQRSALAPPDPFCRCRKRLFLSHLYLEMIVLPRQARDKHWENSKKCRFLLPDPFCSYLISTRYCQVRRIHKQLSRVIPVRKTQSFAPSCTKKRPFYYQDRLGTHTEKALGKRDDTCFATGPAAPPAEAPHRVEAYVRADSRRAPGARKNAFLGPKVHTA